ncbi:hypothetical protein [Paenibacillus dendritiformis]|uniref:hypothetical protein n=1 Tax=Paenibacillus dendritiformis TaxID=130049 RepID=UPI001F550F0C|nr:hypothetical protein [Paenibacillus dendritiformis]
MKVTETGAKGSQLPKGGFAQKDSAEHEGYAEAHIPARITETDNTNADLPKDGILEQIVSRNNLNEAFKRVKANKCSHGIDGMGVDELL